MTANAIDQDNALRALAFAACVLLALLAVRFLIQALRQNRELDDAERASYRPKQDTLRTGEPFTHPDDLGMTEIREESGPPDFSGDDEANEDPNEAA